MLKEWSQPENQEKYNWELLCQDLFIFQKRPTKKLKKN